MSVYNLKECSDVYLKTSRSLWHYYRDEPDLDDDSNIIDFPAHNNDSVWFKFNQQITGQTENYGTKNVQINCH